jgi:hypothetical protein
MEDQAIHKSVASFVDSAYRTKARASNCYIKKSGWFVFQPEHIFSPAFQISYEDKSLYFELNQDLSCPSGAYEAYLSALLRAAHPSSL